jgi:hypothetical protein
MPELVCMQNCTGDLDVLGIDGSSHPGSAAATLAFQELLLRGAAFVIAKPFDLNELAKAFRLLTHGVPPIDENRAAESSYQQGNC